MNYFATLLVTGFLLGTAVTVKSTVNTAKGEFGQTITKRHVCIVSEEEFDKAKDFMCSKSELEDSIKDSSGRYSLSKLLAFPFEWCGRMLGLCINKSINGGKESDIERDGEKMTFGEFEDEKEVSSDIRDMIERLAKDPNAQELMKGFLNFCKK